MYGLISAFSFLGTYQVARALLSAVRTKLIAILLGPNGLGIFSQAKSFQLITRYLVTLGLSEGIVNLVAEANADDDQLKGKRIVLTISLIYAFLGSVVLTLSWLFKQPLSEWVFGSSIYGNLIVIVGVSAFFLAQYYLMFSVLRGLLKWKLYATVAILSYAISIGVSSVIILVFGLVGAVFSLVITQVIGLTFGLILTKLPVREVLSGGIHPDWDVVKALMKYVGPLLGGELVLLFTNLYIRRSIILHLGADQSGLYHVLVSVSNIYFWGIIQPVTAYSMPKVAGLVKDKKAVVEVQNNGIRLSLLGLFPIIVLVYGLREMWIPIFFSSDFLAAGNLLMWWLIGDVFRALWVVMEVDLVPFSRLKFKFLQPLLYSVGLIVVTVSFISMHGLKAAALAYLVTNIMVFLISYLYHLRTTAYRLSTDNLLLLTKAAGILAISLWFSNTLELNVVRLLVILLSLGAMYLGLPKPSERRYALFFVQEKARDFLKSLGKEN